MKFENINKKKNEYKNPEQISDHLINGHPSQKSPSI